MFARYWRGEGRVVGDFEFSLQSFSNWHHVAVNDVLAVTEAYSKAMQDQLLTDDERDQLTLSIEKVFSDALAIMVAISASID